MDFSRAPRGQKFFCTDCKDPIPPPAHCWYSASKPNRCEKCKKLHSKKMAERQNAAERMRRAEKKRGARKDAPNRECSG